MNPPVDFGFSVWMSIGQSIACLMAAIIWSWISLTGLIEFAPMLMAEQLDQIKAENIRAVADLTDIRDSTGSYLPPVKIYVDGVTDVGAVGQYQISVDIRKVQS